MVSAHASTLINPNPNTKTLINSANDVIIKASAKKNINVLKNTQAASGSNLIYLESNVPGLKVSCLRIIRYFI